jgi:TorA maturation chaperone TorD
MKTESTLKFEAPDQGEDLARADLYGLLAALFYASPPQVLLDSIASSKGEGGGVLEDAWQELVNSSRGIDAQQAREEYEDLFIGVGKPEVMLYGSFYLTGFLMERPLAQLRTDLAQLGLERADSVVESEDHIASLCEVMRYLIASDDVINGRIEMQHSFYATHIQPWVDDMCTALQNHPRARFYSAVGQLTQRFFEVESQAFEMN